MIVKFKTGASAYGLGYTAGEVAKIEEVKTRVLTTLVDAKNNPIGQDWRDQVFTAEDLIEKGICVQASAEETTLYKEKNPAKG